MSQLPYVRVKQLCLLLDVSLNISTSRSTQRIVNFFYKLLYYLLTYLLYRPRLVNVTLQPSDERINISCCLQREFFVVDRLDRVADDICTTDTTPTGGGYQRHLANKTTTLHTLSFRALSWQSSLYGLYAYQATRNLIYLRRNLTKAE